MKSIRKVSSDTSRHEIGLQNNHVTFDQKVKFFKSTDKRFLQESMETLTGPIALLSMFQASIMIFGATLILTSDMCSKGKIQTRHFFFSGKKHL